MVVKLTLGAAGAFSAAVLAQVDTVPSLKIPDTWFGLFAFICVACLGYVIWVGKKVVDNNEKLISNNLLLIQILAEHGVRIRCTKDGSIERPQES